MIDRRHQTRYYFGSIAEVVDLDSHEELISIARDLSLSGCFIKTPTPYEKGKEVRVRLRHSGADFAAIGKITENNPDGMGIEFVEIAPADRVTLRKWLGLNDEETESVDLPTTSDTEELTGNIPLIVTGQSATGSFTEETETQAILPNGALLRLAADVSSGQVVRLKNRLTRVEQDCRVLYVDQNPKDNFRLLAVEFLNSAQNFWKRIKPQP